jgi:hypothetical protein
MVPVVAGNSRQYCRYAIIEREPRRVLEGPSRAKDVYQQAKRIDLVPRRVEMQEEGPRAFIQLVQVHAPVPVVVSCRAVLVVELVTKLFLLVCVCCAVARSSTPASVGKSPFGVRKWGADAGQGCMHCIHPYTARVST